MQVMHHGIRLLSPMGLVRQQGFAVHKERGYMREVGAQLVQDGETVGVDISPVVDGAIVQPTAARQRLPAAIAGPKDHDGLPYLRESQKVGFVLGDEYAPNGRCEATKTNDNQKNNKTNNTTYPLDHWIKNAEAYACRLFHKAVAGGKLVDTRLHGVNASAGSARSSSSVSTLRCASINFVCIPGRSTCRR